MTRRRRSESPRARGWLRDGEGGFALSGPRYYKLFETSLLEMVTKYDVNQFKIDGTGNVNQVFPGSLFDSDFSAAIHLIERLRQQDPSVFII